MKRMLVAGLLLSALAAPVAAYAADKSPEFDPDILLVRKMENCAGLMAVLSDNNRAKGNTEVADTAALSSGQYATAARYYAGAKAADRVDRNVATAKEKLAYLYANGGDAALADDIRGCGSEEMATKGQAALDAQKKADEAAANKGK